MGFCPVESLGPGVPAPLLALGFVQMIRAQRRFRIATAERLEELGARADLVEHAKALIDHLLDHRGSPASRGKPGQHWPLLNKLGQFLWLDEIRFYASSNP